MQGNLGVVANSGSSVVTPTAGSGVTGKVDIYSPAYAASQVSVSPSAAGGYDVGGSAIPMVVGRGGYMENAATAMTLQEIEQERVATLLKLAKTTLELSEEENKRLVEIRAQVAVALQKAQLGVAAPAAMSGAGDVVAETTAEVLLVDDIKQDIQARVLERAALDAFAGKYEWELVLGNLADDIARFRRETGVAKSRDESNKELEYLAREYEVAVELLRQERLACLQRITANYDKINAGLALSEMNVVMQELDSDLRYLSGMPSLAAMDANCAQINGLVTRLASLRSGNLYATVYNSAVKAVEVAARPLDEFAKSFGSEASAVGVEDFALAPDLVRQGDVAVHDEVAKLVGDANKAIDKKTLQDEAAVLLNKLKVKIEDLEGLEAAIDQKFSQELEAFFEEERKTYDAALGRSEADKAAFLIRNENRRKAIEDRWKSDRQGLITLLASGDVSFLQAGDAVEVDDVAEFRAAQVQLAKQQEALEESLRQAEEALNKLRVIAGEQEESLLDLKVGSKSVETRLAEKKSALVKQEAELKAVKSAELQRLEEQYRVIRAKAGENQVQLKQTKAAIKAKSGEVGQELHIYVGASGKWEEKRKTLADAVAQNDVVLQEAQKARGSFFGRIVYRIRKGKSAAVNVEAFGKVKSDKEAELSTHQKQKAELEELLKSEKDLESAIEKDELTKVAAQEALEEMRAQIIRSRVDLDSLEESAFRVKEEVKSLEGLIGKSQAPIEEMESLVARSKAEISRLENEIRQKKEAVAAAEQELAKKQDVVTRIGRKVGKIAKRNFAEANNLRTLLDKKAAMEAAHAQALPAFDPSLDEGFLLALARDAMTCNGALMTTSDMMALVVRQETVAAKQQIFEATLAEKMSAAFETALRVKSGEEELKKNTSREALRLVGVAGRAAGETAAAATAVTVKVVDKVLETWQKTQSDNVAAVSATLGDVLPVVIDEVSRRISALYACDVSPESAFNRFKKEATITGLATQIAVSLVEAIGDEAAVLGGRRPSSEDVVEVDGVRRIREGAPIGDYIDDLISHALERSHTAEKLKMLQKATLGRATTEESSRGNITAMGAKQGVGLEFYDDAGVLVRLVPEGRENAKYGFRRATKGEMQKYREGALENYKPYVVPEIRFKREFDKLAAVLSVHPALASLDAAQREDLLSRMVVFAADQKQYLFGDKSVAVSLRAFAEKQAPGLVLPDHAVELIETLATLYNEATDVKTKKGIVLAGYRVDPMQGVSVALSKAMQNQYVLEKLGEEDPLATGRAAMLDDIDGGISDVFKASVLEPQEAVLGQLRMMIEKQLTNPDFDFFTAEARAKTSDVIFEDLVTMVQLNSRSMAKRDDVVDEVLRNSGLFNLTPPVSPANLAKFAEMKKTVVALARIDVAFLEDHTADEARVYCTYNSAPRISNEAIVALCLKMFDSADALAAEKRAELERIVVVYEARKDGNKMLHKDAALVEVLQQELDAFCDKFSMPKPEAAARAEVEVLFKRAADAKTLVEGRNTDVGFAGLGKAKAGVAVVADTAKSGVKTQRAVVAAGRGVMRLFTKAPIREVEAGLKPAAATMAELETRMTDFYNTQAGSVRSNSLLSAGALFSGSAEEQAQQFCGMMKAVAKRYADEVMARAHGAVTEDGVRLLAGRTCEAAITKLFNSDKELKAVLNLKAGNASLEADRRLIRGVFADLVKMNVAQARGLAASAEAVVVEGGYTQSGVAVDVAAAVSTPAKSYDQRLEELALKLGIADEANKQKLRDGVEDYVSAIGHGGDVRKYKTMLMTRLKDVAPGFGARVLPQDRDFADGLIHTPELRAVVDSCRVELAARVIDSKDNSVVVVGCEEKLRRSIPVALVLKVPHTAADIVDKLCAAAKSPEFVAANYEERKKMLAEFAEPGSTTRSKLSGKVVAWSEDRMRFDSVLDCMSQLGDACKVQARGASPVATGGVIVAASTTSAISLASSVSASSLPATATCDVEVREIVRLAKEVKTVGGKLPQDVINRVVEGINQIAAIMIEQRKVGASGSAVEEDLIRESAKLVLGGERAATGFSGGVMNIGSVSMISRSGERRQFDEMLRLMKVVANSVASGEGRIGSIDVGSGVVTRAPREGVAVKTLTHMQTGRDVPKGAGDAVVNILTQHVGATGPVRV